MNDIEHRGRDKDASQRLSRLRESIREAELMGDSVLAAQRTMAYVSTISDQSDPGAPSDEPPR